MKPHLRIGVPSEPGYDIEALFERERPRLVNYLRRKIGRWDEADDLAQDAFLRFVRSAPKAGLKSPEAYLRQIAINLVRDYAGSSAGKLQASSYDLPEDSWDDQQIDQHRILEGQQRLAYYEAALLRLKPKTLQIFLLSRVEGLGYRQIAQRMEMSEGGIKRHMVKAIHHLARARAKE